MLISGSYSKAKDSSGTLQCVRVCWHGGAIVGANHEINSITFGGGCSCTLVDHCKVAYNLDDGFELFGGTVNVKHLRGLFAGDDAFIDTEDAFDKDVGYMGKGRFLLMIEGLCGDRSMEIDSSVLVTNLGMTLSSTDASIRCAVSLDEYRRVISNQITDRCSKRTMTEASWALLRTLTLLQSELATVNAEIQPLLKLSDITRIISTTVVHSIKQAAAYHITALVTALVTVLLALRHPRRRRGRRIKTRRLTTKPEASLKVLRIRGGMPNPVTSTPTEDEKKTIGWMGRALKAAGRGLNTYFRIRLASRLTRPEQPSSEVEFMVETSSVTFWPSEDSQQGQPKHGAVVARDDKTITVEEFATGELIVLNFDATALAWGHHPFNRRSSKATKAIAQAREPPRLHTEVKSVGDSVHDTVSHAVYMTMEHGPTFGGLTPKTERPSVREVSLASEPMEPTDSDTLKHSTLHEILRVTRTILPRARAWAYGHFARHGAKPSGGKKPHWKAPGLTEPTLWAKKGLAAKIAFQGDVAKMARDNGLFARVGIGADSDEWHTWRMNSGTPDGPKHNIPEGDERSAKVLREAYEARHFAAMIKQKGLGTQLSSIDGSDPPEAQLGPLLGEPVDEAIKAALAYTKRRETKTCIICSDVEQKKLIPRNLTAVRPVCGKFLSHPRFLAELSDHGFGFCECEVAWNTTQTELEIRVIERLNKELELTPKPNRGSIHVAMAIRLSGEGINLPGRTPAQWKKCTRTDDQARTYLCKFMRLTSSIPRLEQNNHVNRDGGRWLNIKNLARQFDMEVPQSESDSD
jgi:hypothetical protein